jgi:hypothetical protein
MNQFAIQIGIALGTDTAGIAGGSPTNYSLLQEDGFEILQEDGFLILLESAP